MGTINLFRNAVKNPLTTVVLVVVTIVMAVVIYGNIHDMHAATTGYDYCQSLCYLFENICVCYFMAIFFTMYYLTYINKQYSKWSIWLTIMLKANTWTNFPHWPGQSSQEPSTGLPSSFSSCPSSSRTP